MKNTAKLTKVQTRELSELRKYGWLFVGYRSPSLVRTFDKLVEKGYAKVVETNQYGKRYQAIG
jgi:hypothetical protein